MISTEKVKNLKERIFAEISKNGFEGEILIHESESTEIKVKNQRVKELSKSVLDKVGVRVFKGNNEGFGSTESFDDASIDSCLADALSNAKVIKRALPVELGEISDYEQTVEFTNHYAKELESFSTDAAREKVMNLDKITTGLDKRVISVDCAASTYRSKETFLNSKGVQKSCKSNGASIYTDATTDNGTFKKDSYHFYSGHDAMSVDVEKVAKKAVDQAIALLDAKSIPSQKIPVILPPEVAQGFIGAISSTLSAKAIDEKMSMFGMCKGETIACEMLTVRDAPLRKNNSSATPFDSEGYPTSETMMIEKGVVKNILTDKFFSKKMDLPHTANGLRGPGSPVSVGVHLMVVDKGDQSLEDLLKVYPKVFLVESFRGGPHPLTGDFSAPAEGHLYVDGKRQHAVHEVTLAGNYKEALKNITGLGNAYNENYFGGILTPHILFKEFDLSGLDS
jgi:PmbA protein